MNEPIRTEEEYLFMSLFLTKKNMANRKESEQDKIDNEIANRMLYGHDIYNESCS